MTWSLAAGVAFSMERVRERMLAFDELAQYVVLS
jgi:hypothetical protein